MAHRTGRPFIYVSPRAALPDVCLRVTTCDACATETVCREGAFSKDLWRRVWLCWKRDDSGCCWQKAEAEKNEATA